MNVDQKNFSALTEIGFALILLGLQFGLAVRNVFPQADFIQLFFLLSFILCTNFTNVIKLRFPSFNKYFLVFLIFNFISFLYLLLFPSKYIQFNNQILIMQLYVFAIIFALSTQNRNLKLQNLDTYLFYISSFISIVILYQVTKGFTGIYLENVFSDSLLDTNRMKEGGDKTNMGRALYMSFITIVVYKSKNKIELFLKPILLVSFFLCLYMFNTRATMVVSVVCVILYSWMQYKIGNKFYLSRKNLILYSIIFIGLIIGVIYLYNKNTYFNVMVNTMFNQINNGISSVLGTENVDESAMIRKGNLKYFFNQMKNLDLVEFFIGHGFIKKYIDVPMIQAFLDLGLFGFIFYAISLIYIPIKFIFSKTSYISHIIILQLFAFHYLLDQLYAGMPYWSTQFMPITLIVFFYINNRKQFTFRKLLKTNIR